MIIYWELFIKEPPIKLISFDKGKTWSGKKCLFPFVPAPYSKVKTENVTYILYKKLISIEEYKNIFTKLKIENI